MSPINVINEISKNDELLNEKCLSIAKDVIERRVIRAMREEDLVFNAMYRDVWYGDMDLTGVNAMPTITVHVILQLPFSECLRFDEGKIPGHLEIATTNGYDDLISQQNPMYSVFSATCFKFLCNSNSRVAPSRVMSWLTTCFEKGFHRLRQYGGLSRIGVRNIKFEKNCALILMPLNWSNIRIRFTPVLENGSPLDDSVIFCRVPSIPQSSELLWESYQPFQETELLKSGGNDTLKVSWLLKRLSLYLKLPSWYGYVFHNIVMLMVANSEWLPDQLDENLLNALKKFKYCKGQIAHWLDDSINLLASKDTKSEVEKVNGAIQLLEDAEKCDPSVLKKYFMR